MDGPVNEDSMGGFNYCSLSLFFFCVLERIKKYNNGKNGFVFRKTLKKGSSKIQYKNIKIKKSKDNK